MMDATEWKMRLMANAPPVPEWWSPDNIGSFVYNPDHETVASYHSRKREWESQRREGIIFSWPKHYAEMVMRTFRA